MTPFVNGMLKEINPKNFDDLIRISGLSHGTDVWFNNAQKLIREGICEFREVIASRDDIMLDLISKGIEEKIAYEITNKVRKGKGIDSKKFPLLKEKGVQDWYIQSCNKIKYMFPKAHAVEYTNNSYKQAWMKLHHSEVFYSAFFTTKTKGFDWEIVGNTIGSIEKIYKKPTADVEKEIEKLNKLKKIYKNNKMFIKKIDEKIKEIERKSEIDLKDITYRIKYLEKLGMGKHFSDDSITIDEDDEFRIDDKKQLLLLLALKECIERGVKIRRVGILKSHETKFIVNDGWIIPPLVTLKYFGEKGAKRFTKERETTSFKSIEDLQKRKIEENRKNIKLVDKRVLEQMEKYSDLKEVLL
ncbi:hypothetical protein [Inediibacterium massiliense]|uniref:helix-hairpin-helix domain-containing protein n=1 Tax=Inediibacterium massiliense TaxID=1658111 RepID=UPI0006B680F8|nr:hypothetical protein [Inediibacterium massiliense]